MGWTFLIKKGGGGKIYQWIHCLFSFSFINVQMCYLNLYLYSSVTWIQSTDSLGNLPAFVSSLCFILCSLRWYTTVNCWTAINNFYGCSFVTHRLCRPLFAVRQQHLGSRISTGQSYAAKGSCIKRNSAQRFCACCRDCMEILKVNLHSMCKVCTEMGARERTSENAYNEMVWHSSNPMWCF